MAAAPKDADVRSVIRSILVSNPNEMTARFLDRDFMEMEGYPIPYNKFGFKSLLDYLRSIPDTVTVKGIAANPVVLPVTTEKSAHVEKLVLKQKRAPSHRMPARRTQNHVSASNNRTRKNGSVSHMPQNGPLAKSLDQLTLPGSTDELNKNDPKKSRLKVNIPCLKRHILSIKKRNDKSLTKARADGSSVRTNTNNSDNPFNRSEIKPKCLQEQVNSFRMKSNYSSYKINESTSQPSQYETNGRKEAAKQEFGADQTQSSANSSVQNSAKKKKKKKKKNNIYLAKKRQQAALRSISNRLDDSSTFSLSVATRLRRMPHHQRDFAQMLINRVLFYGISGNLSSATELSNIYHYPYYNSYYNSYY